MQHLYTILAVTAALLLSPLTLAQAPRVPVETERVQEQTIREVVRLTGTVTSARASNLSPATTGLVTHVAVDAGSIVQAGDVVLEMDRELAHWQAQSAQAAVEASRVALEDARRRLREARALAPQQSIAETVVQDLVAEVAQDEAALQQAQAEAGYRSAILDRHQIRAPYDGVVAAKLSEVGEWVTPGDAVLTLVATTELRIDFPVAETYMPRIAPGDPVTFTTSVTAGGDTKSGSVATVVPISDPGARTFLLRVSPGEHAAQLRPGMSVHGQIELDAGRSAPVVSRDAIIRYPDGRVIVWVVDDNGGDPVVTERVITPGLAFDGLVEVRSGLEQGTPVVVKGNEALQVSQRVSVRERNAD